MNLSFITSLLLLTSVLNTNAQVKISTDSNPPDNSAMLDIKSTNKVLLPPRMTHAQLDAISDPANGLSLFIAPIEGQMGWGHYPCSWLEHGIH